MPRTGFGTRMENNYIFWDGNGIGGARPKPVPLPSLLEDIGYGRGNEGYGRRERESRGGSWRKVGKERREKREKKERK